MVDESRILKVMISSTIVDLPKHREEVRDACLEQGMLPLMMEYQPACDSEAIDLSLNLVNDADIYVGVYAHRYGYVPKDGNFQKISITEMEYDRAKERRIPRLIFIIDKTHPADEGEIEKEIGIKKLRNFSSRVKIDNFVNFFKSPEDLRAKVINSLSKVSKKGNTAADSLNTDGIPACPEIYVAHPYTLLQTDSLVGRRQELDLLKRWAGESGSGIHKTHILSIVAMGGMGKSALLWKWFHDDALAVMRPLAGRMWWSFYESDANFENFIIYALAYTSGSSLKDVREIPGRERETRLFANLNTEPFLLVLDGLERLLLAYAMMGSTRPKRNEVADHRNFRKTSDPRVGQFLKKLTQVENSRILISTRLQPIDLETEVETPLSGVFRYDLDSLSDDDAVEFWRTLGVKGSRDTLLPVFKEFGKHTLLIQALAGEVSRFRRAPGDLEKWRTVNPRFDPAKYSDLKERMSHVLGFALKGLGGKPRDVLNIIAAFRMTKPYDTLAVLLTGEGKPCANENELDKVLTELEGRGLLGWDKSTNRYNLHPIVRGVVWSSLDDDEKQGVYTILRAYFESETPIDYTIVKSLDDLTPAIELYNTLIGLGRYEDACNLFYEQLEKPTLYRLGASRLRVELLEMLFQDGLDRLPRLTSQDFQAYAHIALAQGYQFSGQPGQATYLYKRANAIDLERQNEESFCIGLCNLSDTVRLTGRFRESEQCAREALGITRKSGDLLQEVVSIARLGLTVATREDAKNTSKLILERALRILKKKPNARMEGVINSILAEQALWLGNLAEATTFADRAWTLANIDSFERGYIRAARLQGEAALGLGNIATADEHLRHALTRARIVDLAEGELPALVAMAGLQHSEGDEKAARALLNDIWECANDGPYPLFHADGLNVLAKIERDAGNTDKAIKAATKAYQLAWCDGPPYAYHWGLTKARKHLEELGAPLPDMPPFDETQFEPMPEVEIDPDDEFHVGAE